MVSNAPGDISAALGEEIITLALILFPFGVVYKPFKCKAKDFLFLWESRARMGGRQAGEMPGKTKQMHFQDGLVISKHARFGDKNDKVCFLLAAERKEGQGQEGGTGPCCSQEAGGQEGCQSSF